MNDTTLDVLIASIERLLDTYDATIGRLTQARYEAVQDLQRLRATRNAAPKDAA